jgi:hypothetical protein
VALAVLVARHDVARAPPLLAVRAPAPAGLRLHAVAVLEAQAPKAHHCMPLIKTKLY